MSFENIAKRRSKARRKHFCDWCWSPIEKGEIYTYNTNITEGNIHDWKECDKCKDLVKEMFKKGWADQKGYCDGDDFSEFMEETYGMSFDEYIMAGREGEG